MEKFIAEPTKLSLYQSSPQPSSYCIVATLPCTLVILIDCASVCKHILNARGNCNIDSDDLGATAMAHASFILVQSRKLSRRVKDVWNESSFSVQKKGPLRVSINRLSLTYIAPLSVPKCESILLR